MEIQTRSEKNGLRTFPTWAEAFEAAKRDPTIWKISWDETNNTNVSRVRLVRNGDSWTYEPIKLDEPVKIIYPDGEVGK